jgi:hypothetical protein
MEMTYENILEFMQKYFPFYSDYGQDPATAERMKDFYAPDFMFTGYVGRPEPLVFPSLDAFLAFDVSHPSSYERLIPEDMTIDERRKTVFVIIKFEFIDRKTGEVLVVERGTTQYQLVLDENGDIKIKSFVFFPQRVAPGVLTGADVFRKDRDKT